MKIAIINQHMQDGLGGSEMQCDLISRGLVNKGHQVTYLAVVTDQSPVVEYKDIDYQIERLKLQYPEKLKELLIKHRPDIVYWRFNKNYLRKSTEIMKELGIPFIFAVSHLDDLTPMSFRMRRAPNLSGKIRAWLSCFAQAARSRYNFSAITRARGLTSLNRSYLPLSPLDNSVGIWNSVSDVVVPFSWPRPFICWVANIKAEKKPEAFIDLARKFSTISKDIDFLMIGSIKQQPYRILIEESMKELSNFHYLGPKSPVEVNGIIKEALFLVHTCKPEGFGNNFIQAWTQGKPTISLSFDPDGLIEKEQLGLYSKNEAQMFEDTKKLVNDHQLRETTGARAQMFARKNFSRERMVNEVETFLKSALGQ